MSLPIEVHPDSSYLFTRNVHGGRHMLAPTREVRQVVTYLAVHFALRHDVPLALLLLMSTHYHAIGDDPEGRYPDFLRDLHSWVARALNLYYFGTEEGLFWSHRKPGRARLEGKHDTLRKLLYAAVNPVAAGIEPSASLWPGYIFGPDMAGLNITATCPAFLREKYPNFPERYVYKVPVPADYDGLPAAQVRGHFRRERLRLERTLQQQRTKPYLTTAVALSQAGPDFCTPEPPRSLNPLFVAGNPDRRVGAIRRRKKFLKDYRACREQLKRGNREVVWPAGTFAMHVRHGMEREESPQRRTYRGPPD